MNYAEMITGLKAAGHDVSGIQHPAAAGVDVLAEAARTTCASLTIDDLADALLDTVHDALAPIEQRLKQLEARGGVARSVEYKDDKPRVKVRALSRLVRPVVRVQALSRAVA